MKRQAAPIGLLVVLSAVVAAPAGHADGEVSDLGLVQYDWIDFDGTPHTVDSSWGQVSFHYRADIVDWSFLSVSANAGNGPALKITSAIEVSWVPVSDPTS